MQNETNWPTLLQRMACTILNDEQRIAEPDPLPQNVSAPDPAAAAVTTEMTAPAIDADELLRRIDLALGRAAALGRYDT